MKQPYSDMRPPRPPLSARYVVTPSGVLAFRLSQCCYPVHSLLPPTSPGTSPWFFLDYSHPISP